MEIVDSMVYVHENYNKTYNLSALLSWLEFVAPGLIQLGTEYPGFLEPA